MVVEPLKINKISADVVIIGGGIAGLWALNHLNSIGFNTILLECNELGSGQTIKSQGIIHGGMKYALNGVLNNETEAIADMPHIWQQALSGRSNINLSKAKIIAKKQFMFSTKSLAARVNNFFASKLLNSRMKQVTGKQIPESLQSNKMVGTVYELNEIVLDIKSVISELLQNYKDKVIKIDSNVIDFKRDSKDSIKSIDININNRKLNIDAKAFILAGGEGNDSHASMQKRPLRMAYFKNKDLKPLYAHAVGSSKQPLFTITTHYDLDNIPVWYIGGKPAEEGINKSEKDLILDLQQKFSAIFPAINFSDGVWGTVYVNRAEEKTLNGKKPESISCLVENNSLIVWPTKLAFAPLLAQQIEIEINKLGISKSDAKAYDFLPQPEIAPYPWD